MKPKRHTRPTDPSCKTTTPLVAESLRQLPPWQRERIRQLDWAMRQITARTDRGETIHSAVRAVSKELQARCPDAAAQRIPTAPGGLIRLIYVWRRGGPTALQQRFGQTLPTVPEAEALAFVNWALGRQGDSFAALFREFKRAGQLRATRPDSTNSSRVNGWFNKLRQRLAEIDADEHGRPTK
jgi:hypothetical protein